VRKAAEILVTIFVLLPLLIIVKIGSEIDKRILQFKYRHRND